MDTTRRNTLWIITDYLLADDCNGLVKRSQRSHGSLTDHPTGVVHDGDPMRVGEANISAPQTLAGKRVLIVEDEALVAFLLEVSLAKFGCIPVGPCSSVAQALEMVETETFDLALLDVNLNGEKVYPVAYALAERHIPFLFVSGYGKSALPPGRSDWKVCAKPFVINDLVQMLLTVMLDANTKGRSTASRSG